MSKKKTPGQKRSKSDEIRQVLKSGIHKPIEVQATLAARGVEVSPQMVSTVKSKMSARRSARQIGRRRASANGAATVTDIKTLARFILAVHDLGGVADARKVLVEMET
jgi:hypothetical protein